jgi:nucleoside-diphosphate-sugar epimerase
MKSAIIAGGNGLIGRALVEELIKKNIPVLILGSAKEMHDDLRKIMNSKISYYQIQKQEFWLEELIKYIKKKVVIQECVFFNLAWRGRSSLTDGTIEDQLRNVDFSCKFVRAAKEIGAKKYVATGSMEEVIFARYVEGDYWFNKKRLIKPSWYALAKVSSRMQSAFEAYHNKIDFCYTRISAVIDIRLRTNKFVENSLKSLLKNQKIEFPKNDELCNLSSSSEIGKQLMAIGMKGLNKRIYTLGTGESASLADYFKKFSTVPNSQLSNSKKDSDKKILLLKENDFRTEYLTIDTGYVTKESTEVLFNKLRKKK